MASADALRRAILQAAVALACIAVVFMPHSDALHALDAPPSSCSPAAWREAQAWRDNILRHAPREVSGALAWVGPFWNRALPRPDALSPPSFADQRLHAQLRYLTLRALGVPAAQLRLIYGVVRDPEGGMRHPAVALAYAPDSTAPMLLLPAHRDAVVSPAALPEWTPVMHGEGPGWADAAPGQAEALPAAICALIEARPRAIGPYTP